MIRENKYIKKLRKMVVEFLKNDNVRIVLFGSRARKEENKYSDIDIGIIPRKGFDQRKIVFLKDEIEKLNIPFKVEIVNFLEVSDDFKKEALKEVAIWKD